MRYAKPIGCTLTAPWNLLAAISAVIVPSAGSTQTFPSSPHTSPLALTDDYAMSALTVAIWVNRTRFAHCETFSG
jgi:hypothetical protein